jgi:hypothetical protein
MTRCTVSESDDGSHTVVCHSTTGKVLNISSNSTRRHVYQGIHAPIHSIKKVSTPLQKESREITNVKRAQDTLDRARIELEKSKAVWEAANADAKEKSNTAVIANHAKNKALTAAAGNGIRDSEYNIVSFASSDRTHKSAFEASQTAKKVAANAKIAMDMAENRYMAAEKALKSSLAQRDLLDPMHHNGGRSRRNRTLRKKCRQRTTRRRTHRRRKTGNI